MDNIVKALFWLSVLSILLMFAGHAWAGTLLGLTLTGLVIAFIVLIIDFLS